MHFKYFYTKNLIKAFLITAFFTTAFLACSSSDSPTYVVSIQPVNDNNVPALQSFVHGVNGSDWLLFAGRTNQPDSLIGGLHNLNANYASTSFIPYSFNESMYVYNIDSNKLWSLPIGTLIQTLNQNLKTNISKTLFINTNPLVTQDDEGYLYVVGGYGPDIADTNYGTYNQIARIYVPSMINLIKGDLENVNWTKLIHVGTDPSNKLISTGGELFEINDTLYLAGGQNGGSTQSSGQQYVSAVYPFTVTDSGLFGLNVNVGPSISDFANPLDSASANNSIFHRRDAPIVPSIYQNGSGTAQGITFYTGVFTANPNALEAWNDAIYVHPDLKINNNLYTYDSLYNQGNNCVYACADFEAYDSNTNLLHTFLLGGIGTGFSSGPNTLSGFTNNGVHITMNIDSLKSSYELLTNVFPPDTTHIYGAESDFVLNQNGPVFYTTTGGEQTEALDLAKTFANGVDSVDVGYIYGGIVAFQPNPGSYGSGLSAASNQIWKVTLKKVSN